MLPAQLTSLAKSPRIARSVQIRRPAIALYTAWHHLSQRPTVPLGAALPPADVVLPRIKVPGGHVAGPTFIRDHIHGLFISWSSELESGVTQSGEVWFHTESCGADSTVSILLSWHTQTAGAPEALRCLHTDLAQLDQDLHRFKSLMEG